jgi:hypothetical protein
MDKKNGQKGKFKSKGVNFLKCSPAGPKSMTEFLAHPEEMDTLDHRSNMANTKRHNGTPAQKHPFRPSGQPQVPDDSRSVTNQIEDQDPNEIARIHVHIRKDLADKLVEAVFNRKRDRSYQRKDATQRVIIEQALEKWFENHPV